MEQNISQTLGELKAALFRSAAIMLVTAVLAKLFLPKPTTIVIDEGIPAELYTVGKKGNPKAVYVTTKKHRVNVIPAVLMAAAAAVVAVVKKQYDSDNGIINSK